MLASSMRLTEYTMIRYNCGSPVTLDHARWLRGAVSSAIDRPEFHHHTGSALVYQHPLIRYATSGDELCIMGVGTGAFLLRSLPRMAVLHLGTADYPVHGQRYETSRIVLGPLSEPVIYRFTTPYLALNQENYALWQRGDPFSRRRLLQRIVVGNLLSLSKAIGLTVTERLRAETELEPDGLHALKPGLRLLGFQGAIRVNFAVPELWGIGKSSGRGFGTLVPEGVHHGEG